MQSIIQSFLLHQIYWFSCCWTSSQFLFCNVWKIWITMKHHLYPFWEKRSSGKLQFSFKENPKEKMVSKQSRLKYSRTPFLVVNGCDAKRVILLWWMGVVSFILISFMWGTVLLERAAPGSREEWCLFHVPGGDCWVQTGAVADGRTGIFPQNKPILAMPGQKCGCAGLAWGTQVWLQASGIRSAGSPEEQWANPQPCLRHDGTRLTLSRVMCAIYCIPGSC